MSGRITDVNHALELLEKAVATRGESYVYRRITTRPGGTCWYEHDGEPSCLIGVTLHLAGYSLEDLKRCDTGSKGKKPLVAGLLYRELEGLSPKVCFVLGCAQTAQDNGYTWGEALAAARSGAQNIPSWYVE